MTIQQKYNRLVLWSVLLLLLTVYAYARADNGPVSGVCYATDGATVTTTYLGGDPYPVPVSAEVEQVEGGYQVTHRALFRRFRMYLPVVAQ
jgi:hypothetical protein